MRAVEATKAGEEHKIISALAGFWKYSTKVIGNAQADTFFAASVKTLNRMVTENRFLVSESKKEKVDLAAGFYILGYDKGLRKYTLVNHGDGALTILPFPAIIRKKINRLK